MTKPKTKAPWFSTFVDTEVHVEIDPVDLENDGWVYMGDEQAKPEKDDLADALRRWHNEVHPGAWKFCDERPCIDVRHLYLEAGSDVVLV